MALVLYVPAWLLARRWLPRFTEEIQIEPLRVRSWLELTTRHDLVGRLTVPTLPALALERPVVVAGNPLADHLYYFRRDNVTVWVVAAQLLLALGMPVPDNVEQARAVAVARSDRRQWLRMACIGVPLLMLTILGVLLDEHWTFQRLGPIVPILAVLIAVSTVLGVIAEVRDSRRIARPLPDLKVPMPRIEAWRYRKLDAVVLSIAVMLNLLSAVVLQSWFGDVAPVNLHAGWAILQLILMVVIVSGYRPGWRPAVLLAVMAAAAAPIVMTWWVNPGPLLHLLPCPPGAGLWVITLVLTVISFVGTGRIHRAWNRARNRDR